MPTKKLRIDAWGRFYQDGKKFQKGSSKKSWTLLLGSGIHQALFKDSIDTPKQKQALEVLGSWDNFLKELFCSSETYFHFKDSPSLQWEMHAIEGGGQKMKNEMARDKERQLHKRAKHMLSEAQDVLYSGAIHSKNYGNISKLIASPSVSDIVSLNLDLGIEEILRKVEFTKKKCQPNENKNPNIKIGRYSHFIYKSDDGDEIKKHIWYPHGNIKNSASMVFGVRQYSLSLSLVESMRRRFKAGECQNEKNLALVGWAGLFFDRPLLIAGASLSHSEWDIWLALTSRWRNYSKEKNKRHQPPVYFLTTPQHHKTLVNMPEFNFWRLEAPDYSIGWKWLSEGLYPTAEKLGK